jgi:hypothetical protein
VDGLQFAALDLVQHGLSGDAEGFGGLVESQPALGRLGLDPVAQGLVDADAPGRAGGDLFGGDEALADPPVECGLAEPEDPLGLGDGDDDDIVAVRSDIGLRWPLIDGMPWLARRIATRARVKGSPVAVRRFCLARITAIARSS